MLIPGINGVLIGGGPLAMMVVRMPALRRCALGGDHDDAPMTYATFGDDMIREMLDILARTLHRRDFEAGRVIDMHMHGRNGDVVVLVGALDQPVRQVAGGVIVDIDKRANTGVSACTFLPQLCEPVTGEVPDDLGAVLIAALGCRGVDFLKQVVVEGYGDALHETLNDGVQSGGHTLTIS